MQQFSVLSLLPGSKRHFSLPWIASGISVCLFAFGSVRLHTTVGAKSVKTEVWKRTILVCMCVSVLRWTVQ